MAGEKEAGAVGGSAETTFSQESRGVRKSPRWWMPERLRPTPEGLVSFWSTLLLMFPLLVVVLFLLLLLLLPLCAFPLFDSPSLVQ